MKNYLVELSMRWTTEIEEAIDRADDEVRYEQIDWDVDYVECLDDEEEHSQEEEK